MENNLLYQSGCNSIYPGIFVPMLGEEEVMAELKNCAEGSIAHPPVNISVSNDFYKIELPIPGINREDLVLFTDNNILSVCVVHHELQGGKNFHLHEFNCDYFDRYITLPSDADTQFIVAEYRMGLLRLHIPKTRYPFNQRHTTIVVY